MSTRHSFDLNIPWVEELDLDVNEEYSSQAGDIANTNHIDLNTIPNGDSGGDDEDSPTEQPVKRKFLTNNEREAIYLAMLERSNNGKIRRGTTRSVASLFSVSMTSVQRIWRRGRETASIGKVDVSHHKTKNCGRKKVHVDIEQLRDIPLSQRTTLQSAACAINVSKTTLIRWKKLGAIKRHSNAIKPLLKDGNKKARLQFCMDMLDKDTLSYDPKFIDMYDIVHIDEKWFYMTKKSEKYYLVPEEAEPHRTCKSKHHIIKVMFLAAYARPRFDEQGNEMFSGKIGIFPFIIREPVKRSSVNRVAGTLETKAMTSVGKDVIKSFLIQKVLPAIRAKWPTRDPTRPIYIQQDNARTHVNPNDPEFREAAIKEGFDIRLMCQPPNSPDFNVLDLGFFRAIQSLQYKECPQTVEELITAVEKSYEIFSSVKANRIFLSLQLCMRESMKIKGCNNYKIPHIDKAALERENLLPCQIRCDQTLIEEVQAELDNI